MAIENKLKKLLFIGLICSAFSCSSNGIDLPDPLISELEKSAVDFRYSKYSYRESKFFYKGQEIGYHFEKQKEKDDSLGIHLLVSHNKSTGISRCHKIIVNYNQKKITDIEKTKEW